MSNTQNELMSALQSALRTLGSQLKLTGMGENAPDFGKSFGRVENESRFCQIMTTSGNFLVDFWDQGVCLVSAGTPDVDELAKAIHLWVDSQCNLDTLSIFEFVEIPPAAYAHESGDEVERKWQSLLEFIPGMYPELGEFVREASQRHGIAVRVLRMSRCFPRSRRRSIQ